VKSRAEDLKMLGSIYDYATRTTDADAFKLGGLMRYNEEYKSPFKLSPTQVVIFIIAVIAFVSIMKVFWPIVV